jgi:nitroimidazol reductase NimA-like FMN-containing flavoprotein (pyridoxamine 5'-phosphate oxidase superfamily)
MEAQFKTYPHTKVKRGNKRATYDVEQVYGILDDTWMCHLGAVVDDRPVVQPNLHWRIGNTLYIHGSSKNGLIRAAFESGQLCINVATLDGLVLARSAFHHSVNYRSVTVFGAPRWVDDPKEAKEALYALVEKTEAGRSKTVRPITDTELKATGVIALELEQVSAKVRTGPPIDDPEDMDWPVWAGVIPFEQVIGEPIQDMGESA